MVNIIQKIVATGKGVRFYYPNPIYFAVHSTANPGATAANHVNYWRNNPRKAVHLVSDWKEAYQCVDFSYQCNQVGNGNPTCIGLEICEATNRSDFEKGLEIARSVILQILDRYGWTIDNNVRSHSWFTHTYGGSDHEDPLPYLRKWGWSWDKFIQYLKEGDDLVTEDQMNQIADRAANKVWEKGIQNPLNNNWQAASDLLRWSAVNSTLIKEEVLREDDPTGREVELKDHDHIKWIAKTISDQTAVLAAMQETLTKITDILTTDDETDIEDIKPETTD